jgi:hypothetical protein
LPVIFVGQTVVMSELHDENDVVAWRLLADYLAERAPDAPAAKRLRVGIPAAESRALTALGRSVAGRDHVRT